MTERYAIVDVETTGFSPTADRVVEVACVLVDGDQVVDRWATLVDPHMPIPGRATAVHGITDDMVTGAPSLAVALRELRLLCNGRAVVAHNAQFDMAFLSGLGISSALCTMRLARALVPEAPNHKNQTLRAFLGLDAVIGADLGAHRALADAIVSAHVLIACRNRYRRRRVAGSWASFVRAAALIHCVPHGSPPYASQTSTMSAPHSAAASRSHRATTWLGSST